MKKLFPLVVLLGVLIHITSCTYEDGPAISLRSKTSRLTGTWHIINNNSGGSNLGITQKIIFEEDGQYTHQIIDQGSLLVDEKGSWEWYSDKHNIRVSVNSTAEEIEVKRLTNKEFWFVDLSNNTKYECEKQ